MLTCSQKQHIYIKNITLSKKWLTEESDSLLPVNDHTIKRSKNFVFEQWKVRAVERCYVNDKDTPLSEILPKDLSYSCKFSSLFIKILFGGIIEGNYYHQYNIINGLLVDINADASDVWHLTEQGIDTYHHDTAFFANSEHLESLESCLPRVQNWIELFLKQYP